MPTRQSTTTPQDDHGPDGRWFVRPMTYEDIPACLSLSTQAGWNQIEADWRRYLRLFADGCLVGCLDGQVVASATLAVYDQQIGWIGMILVEQAHRGRGLGTRMFGAIVEVGLDRGLAILGLDATDLGRPLYLKHGFADRGPVHRWRADRAVGGPSRVGDAARPLQPEDWAAMLELDRAGVGVDREPLLRHLAHEPGALVLVPRDGAGFGFCRGGRTACHLGPIVARDAQSAIQLVDALIALALQRDPDGAFFMDAPQDTAIGDLLPGRGFQIQRHLTRMTRPGGVSRQMLGPNIQALSGFELG